MINSADQFAERLFTELALDPQANYFVAFSGGMDSTVLLHMMRQAQIYQKASTGKGFELTALHVNHRLQPASNDWQRHCQQVCDEWHIPYKTVSLQLENNSESLARNARYQWFSEQIENGSVLLTAHHQQDRAETLLFNLMRGAGSQGLSSLRPVRSFMGAKLVRPLLNLTRAQVKQYAQTQCLQWVEDLSNQTDDYSRNQLRHHVLPALTEFREDAVRNIERAASNLERENDLLREVAICDLVEVAELPKHPVDDSYAICYQDFSHLSHNRQANLLRFWLQSLRLHNPSKRLLDDLLLTMSGNPSSSTILQEKGWQFRFYRGFMYVMPAMVEERHSIAMEWNNINQPIELYNHRIRVDATNKLRELIQSRQPSHVRLISRPEVQNPKALQGHSLNLKKWLQDIGVPPWRRHALPLLTLEQSNVNVVLAPVCQQISNEWVSLECPIAV